MEEELKRKGMKVKARHGLLMWHKGRRGRTTTTAEGASTSSEGGNDPPRITGRRGKVSVKKQIELVRRLREQEQQNGDSGAKKRAKPTKKETADLPEEEVLRRQVERRRKQAKSSLSKLFKESIHGDIPLLVVDGYNVIHKDDHAKRLMSTGEMRGAREYLLANLDEYAHLRGLHVRCVFDAEGAVGTETRQEGTAFGTEVVFVTDMSADEYIERDIARVIDDLEAPEVYIATGDRYTVFGGFHFAPFFRRLLKWCMHSEQSVRGHVRRAGSTPIERERFAQGHGGTKAESGQGKREGESPRGGKRGPERHWSVQ